MRFSRLPLITVAIVVGLVGSTFAVAGTASAQSAKPKADDVGITATEIHLAVIADVDTPIQPGLFEKSVDAMKAWAKVVNKDGGIAGRKVVIDFIDSKLNPNETRNAIIKACADDFAMVGGEALFMSNVDDMVACKNSAGQPIGIPDMPGNALDNNQACSPVTLRPQRSTAPTARRRTITRRPTPRCRGTTSTTSRRTRTCTASGRSRPT